MVMHSWDFFSRDRIDKAITISLVDFVSYIHPLGHVSPDDMVEPISVP